ncbi:MAG: hypothetical protein ACOVT5_00340, partial [Armatimonadaceae bacterium]
MNAIVSLPPYQVANGLSGFRPVLELPGPLSEGNMSTLGTERRARLGTPIVHNGNKRAVLTQTA